MVKSVVCTYAWYSRYFLQLWKSIDMICLFLKEFSKPKESTLHVIWNAHTLFLLCGAENKMLNIWSFVVVSHDMNLSQLVPGFFVCIFNNTIDFKSDSFKNLPSGLKIVYRTTKEYYLTTYLWAYQLLSRDKIIDYRPYNRRLLAWTQKLWFTSTPFFNLWQTVIDPVSK